VAVAAAPAYRSARNSRGDRGFAEPSHRVVDVGLLPSLHRDVGADGELIRALREKTRGNWQTICRASRLNSGNSDIRN